MNRVSRRQARGANNPGARHGCLNEIILKVVFNKFTSAHGEKADILIYFLLTQGPELSGQEQQLGYIPGAKRSGVGRRSQ